MLLQKMKSLALAENLALIGVVVNANEEKMSQDGENNNSLYFNVDKQPIPFDGDDTASLSAQVGFFPVLERFEFVALDASV